MSDYDDYGSHTWDPQPARFEPHPLPHHPVVWQPPSQSVYDMVREMQRIENERLEMLVMEMLADPRRPGISIIEQEVIISLDRLDEYSDDRYFAEQRTLMRLDKNVPDANIFRFPSHSAYLNWVEAGCPVE